MEKYRVIGLDLSKKSTGVSIIDVENLKLKVIDVFSIRLKKEDEFNKLYFYAKEVLQETLKWVFKNMKYKFSVAFEFNVFSNYTSELQFYLTQEVLDLCYANNINAVGYSPLFLKKFIKLFVCDGGKYPSRLEKVHIRSIYERYVYPLNQNVLPKSKFILDDDSMDALFLGILGSILHGSFLGDTSDFINNEITTENILNHKFDSLLFVNSNYYSDNYLENIYDFKFKNFKFNKENIKFGEQFKGLIKDSKVSNHLTLRSKMFFPFEILYVLTCRMRAFRLKHPDEFYKFWTKYLGTRKSYLEKQIPRDRDFVCLINKRGSYFLYSI